jgi:hypothetical protein
LRAESARSAFDDDLLAEAMAATGLPTKKAEEACGVWCAKAAAGARSPT